MAPEKKIRGELDETLGDIDPGLRKVLLSWALRRPSKYLAFGKLVRSYRRAGKLRREHHGNGLTIPPFLILSLTARCNLDCSGCYAASSGIRSGAATAGELGPDAWKRIIADASRAGVYSFILAGGEPFLFPGLLDLCDEFPENIFIIVTNGTAISDADMERFKKLHNVVIVASVEGNRKLTDDRRGAGVHAKVMDVLARLGQRDVVTGISVTVNRQNYRYWMQEEHMDHFIGLGIKLAVFLEFIPMTPGSDRSCSSELTGSMCPSADAMRTSITDAGSEMMMPPSSRGPFRSAMQSFRTQKKIYLIHSPGDEEYFGGCVSAGRGFAHVTPRGDVTPCPVSSIATHNLLRSTFTEAMGSPLFVQIRADTKLLETSDTPCALAAHPEEVSRLARETGAYRTDGDKTGSVSPVDVAAIADLTGKIGSAPRPAVKRRRRNSNGK